MTMLPIAPVEESSGVVEVCVEVLRPMVSCPVAFPFEFIVHTLAGTASMCMYVSQDVGFILFLFLSQLRAYRRFY